MRPFVYQRTDDIRAATHIPVGPGDITPQHAASQFIAGGTTMLDLMKLDVMHPAVLVDINPLAGTRLSEIEADAHGVRFGALVRMAQAAEHPVVRRDYPVIAEALNLGASQQLRNMASLGGNLLQRTRCSYFRDVSWNNCNKRNPGSGCAALDGLNRMHAILGTSEHCIATYPGDFAQALIALDASIEVSGPQGDRTIPMADLHRQPGDTPHIETDLKPGELITMITVPAGPWTRRSLYLKVRDRASYEFALASAAVALDLNDGAVREVRIALGGVATVPWRAFEAEMLLRGKPLTEQNLQEAAEAAFAHASPRKHNAYKIPLGQRTLTRALLQAAAMEI